MRFEVRYPNGAVHEVELQGTVAVLGRDPSCDLVLNDSKCSRRHAVLEAGPQGIAVRDAGSANGIYVNGAKVERSTLKEGDVVRLGEVQLKVLPEEVVGTVVMGPEDMADLSEQPTVLPPRGLPVAPPPKVERAAAESPARPAPPRPPTPPRPAPPPAAVSVPAPPTGPTPAARSGRADHGESGPIPRPMTLTVLAVLWAVSILAWGGGGIAAAASGIARGAAAGAALGFGVLMAMVSAALAYGLWTRSSWARGLQIAVAILGLVNCPFVVATVAVLVYMLRADTRIHFSGRFDYRQLTNDEAATLRASAVDGIFTAAILAGVVIGVFALAIAGAVAGPGLLRARAAAAGETSALEDVRALMGAESAFRGATCNAGYADLDGLVKPSTTIPAYPPTGPAFLPASMTAPERYGYRFELTTAEPVPASDGCPSRSFRTYRYAATALAAGSHSFLGTSEGRIHHAKDRAATTTDPLVN